MTARKHILTVALTFMGTQAYAQIQSNPVEYNTVTILTDGLPFRQFNKVEVTGSAILAKEAREALPVQVITRRDIEQSGARDLPALLQLQPVMQNYIEAGAVTGTVLGGPEAAAIHGNQSGTLILLNGRRLPYYGSQTIAGERAVVDLNFLPLSAIERIDILTDGASTRYGSDAVSGVVNVITRSQQQGFTLDVENSLPALQGGARKGLNLSWGMGSIEQDGYSLRTHLAVSHQDAVQAGSRPAASQGAAPWTVNGQTYWSWSKPNTTLTSAPARTYIDADGNYRNTYYDAHGQCESGWYEITTGNCRRNAQSNMTLYPEQNKKTLFVQAERVLSNNWLLHGDLLLGQQTQDTVPRGYSYGFYQQGADDRTYLMTGESWGLLRQRYTNNMRHGVVGLKGEAAGWDVTANLSRGSHAVERIYNGGLLKPGYNGVQLQDNEIFLSPSDYSVVTKDLLASYIDPVPRVLDTGKSTLTAIDVLMSRTLFDTDDGPVQWGLGLDARQEEVQYALGNVITSGVRSPWSGSRSIWALYSEVQWPLSQDLEATTSLRHDHYSDFGGVTTGKIGWKLRATESTWLRGSLGTGFRAPTLGQMANASESISYSYGYAAWIDTQGNPKLKPERSRQWTLGLQMTPNRQWTIGADIWNLDISNTFGALSADTIMGSEALQTQYVSVVGSTTHIYTPNINLGDATSQGVDYYARWRQPMNVGRFQLAVHGTAMLKSMRHSGESWVSNLGRYDDERASVVARHRLSVIPGFELDGWTYSAALRYRSGYNETATIYSMADGSELTYAHRVASFTTLDLLLQGKWSKNWNFSAGLLNVMNRYPAFTFQTGSVLQGVNTQMGDYLGRRLDLRMQYRF